MRGTTCETREIKKIRNGGYGEEDVVLRYFIFFQIIKNLRYIKNILCSHFTDLTLKPLTLHIKQLGIEKY